MVVTTAAVKSASVPYSTSSLYVGDLHVDVDEKMLYDKFSSVGPVLSIRVCRDAINRRSLGYAYVNYQQASDAERALESLNFDVLMGKPMRLMWSQRDPAARRSASSNIFIKNLEKSIDNKAIFDTFSAFGTILSCKVACDGLGVSKGYGFVHFETEESALKAIEKVNGMMLEDKKVYVGKFIPRTARLLQLGETGKKFTNVFVKNFADEMDKQKLEEMFGKFGKITSAVVMLDDEGKSKGFGFVAYENPDDAEKATKEMHDYELKSGRKLFVCRAKKKLERAAEVKRRYELLKIERLQHYQGVNLYVKNIDDSFTDQVLHQTFAKFGNITSAKVMYDENNRSKGFGFVCFEKPEEATKACNEMNGTVIGSKPLYVAMAQRKEDRRAQLASLYLQKVASMRMQNPSAAQSYICAPNSAAMYVTPNIQGQGAASALITAPAAASMRPGLPRWSAIGTTASNPGLPAHYLIPHGYGQLARPVEVPRSPVTATGLSRGQNFNAEYNTRTSGASNGVYMHPRQKPYYQQGGHRQPVSQYKSGTEQMMMHKGDAYASSQKDVKLGPPSSYELAQAPPNEQKQIIGERLFPMISRLHPGSGACKITGMILEMDNSDLLMLFENENLLKDRVEEAAAMLRAASGSVPAKA